MKSLIWTASNKEAAVAEVVKVSPDRDLKLETKKLEIIYGLYNSPDFAQRFGLMNDAKWQSSIDILAGLRRPAEEAGRKGDVHQRDRRKPRRGEDARRHRQESDALTWRRSPSLRAARARLRRRRRDRGRQCRRDLRGRRRRAGQGAVRDQPRGPRRRLRVAGRPLRLRQEHAAQGGRRPDGADARQRHGRRLAAARPAPCRPHRARVPAGEPDAVAEGRGQHRAAARPGGGARRGARRGRQHRRADRASSASRASRRSIRTSCPAACSSASRWRARSRSIRPCC